MKLSTAKITNTNFDEQPLAIYTISKVLLPEELRRSLQLLTLLLLRSIRRNGTWRFLEGVKVSGAPPPRIVIVQQCLRDKGVLELLCNYESPSKKFQPSTNVIFFCTVVFIKLLGTVVTVDDDIVKRILPFVVSGLQSGIKGLSNHKVCLTVSVWLQDSSSSPLLLFGSVSSPMTKLRLVIDPVLLLCFVQLWFEEFHLVHHILFAKDLPWYCIWNLRTCCRGQCTTPANTSTTGLFQW